MAITHLLLAFAFVRLIEQVAEHAFERVNIAVELFVSRASVVELPKREKKNRKQLASPHQWFEEVLKHLFGRATTLEHTSHPSVALSVICKVRFAALGHCAKSTGAESFFAATSVADVDCDVEEEAVG